MRIVSFDAFRSLGLPGVQYLKPDQFQLHTHLIQAADWVVFPEYWQINALHYGLKARLFPSLSSYHIGHNKIEQSRVFKTLWPRHVPDTLILENTPENAERIWVAMSEPFVAKTPKSSEGRGVFLIETKAQWRSYCAAHPVLYAQEYLPIDRDLRIVVVGRQVIGGYWRLQGSDGFHNNLAQGGQLDLAPLPDSAVQLVTQMATLLGIDHGGFDVAMLGNHPYVLEFNRLFGNHGLSEQGIRPVEFIERYLAAELMPSPNKKASLIV